MPQIPLLQIYDMMTAFDYFKVERVSTNDQVKVIGYYESENDGKPIIRTQTITITEEFKDENADHS